MTFILELVIALIITIIFIQREKPKLKFLFYGYAFFLLSMLLQVPVQLFQGYLYETKWITIPSLVFTFVLIVIGEFTKYFSLKRFLHTKSYKNAILFGIGWVSLESINQLTLTIFSYIFSLFSIPFQEAYFLGEQYSFLTFPFFFMINLAITVFVIIAVLKKKISYVFSAILFAIVVSYGLYFAEGVELLLIATMLFLYSIYVIFRYRNLK